MRPYHRDAARNLFAAQAWQNSSPYDRDLLGAGCGQRSPLFCRPVSLRQRRQIGQCQGLATGRQVGVCLRCMGVQLHYRRLPTCQNARAESDHLLVPVAELIGTGLTVADAL